MPVGFASKRGTTSGVRSRQSPRRRQGAQLECHIGPMSSGGFETPKVPIPISDDSGMKYAAGPMLRVWVCGCK
jgi:hypothetical protein